ncbi:MAG: trypsin-like peptidase domain-containing protein [Anaerovoracaceae bacterium]
MNNDENNNNYVPNFELSNMPTENKPPLGDNIPPKNKKPARFVTRTGMILMICTCVILSGIFGFAGTILANNFMPTTNSYTGSSGSAKATGFDLKSATGSSMTVQEITKSAKTSVVEIKTETVGNDSWMQEYVTEGAGSGVIIKDNGYIITNNHVIDGASKIYVTLSNNKEYKATLVGTDSTTDVAVLKIKAKNLTAATLGDSSNLNVGDMAVAIGNPLGELGGTVTAGIISALDRELSIDGKTMSLLQTDSSINPGNSGGGLFNQFGQLVGVVVAKSSGSDVEGLGFAIPINKAANVAKQLIDNGYVAGTVTTGMAYSEASPSQNGGEFLFGEKMGNAGGVYIAQVNSRVAKSAGFKAGDMVYAVDETPIDSVSTLSSIITSHKVGDTVEYIVLRDGQTKTIKLKLQEKKSA